MTEQGWNRREFAKAATLLALVAAAPGCATMPAAPLDEERAPDARQSALFREVAEQVFPTTDTPGAGVAGTGAFVLLALAHGLDGTREALAPDAVSTAIRPFLRADNSLRHADWLVARLDLAASGDWLSASPATRAATLAAIDAEAFAPGAGAHPWRKIKNLIVTGYYTSREGGWQELRYAAVPGRYDPAVPLAPGDRAFSNEWNGVEFG